MCKAPVAKLHHALVRSVQSAHDVQERTLARPVRADDRADLAFRHMQVDILQRHHAAERNRNAFERQHRNSRRCRCMRQCLFGFRRNNPRLSLGLARTVAGKGRE
jgi:hypothetical protein